MIKKCNNCNIRINIPIFNEEEKLELWALNSLGLLLFFIDKIKNISNLNSIEAKTLNSHINLVYGKCFNCNYNNLISENTECPKCKTFNLNCKIIQSFNSDFCSHLEYYLSATLNNSNNPELNQVWCDGISNIPYNIKECSIKNIQKNKQIITEIHIGKHGQAINELTINLGEKSLYNYIHGLSLIDGLPNFKTDDWIDFDLKNDKVSIFLL